MSINKELNIDSIYDVLDSMQMCIKGIDDPTSKQYLFRALVNEVVYDTKLPKDFVEPIVRAAYQCKDL